PRSRASCPAPRKEVATTDRRRDLAALVDEFPSEVNRATVVALRRRRNLEHVQPTVEDVARSDGHMPEDLVDSGRAHPYGTVQNCIDVQAHPDDTAVPAACDQSAVRTGGGANRVGVELERIPLEPEGNDLLL